MKTRAISECVGAPFRAQIDQMPTKGEEACNAIKTLRVAVYKAIGEAAWDRLAELETECK